MVKKEKKWNEFRFNLIENFKYLTPTAISIPILLYGLNHASNYVFYSFIALGLILFFLGIGLTIFKSIPPSKYNLSELIGKEIPLSQINNTFPEIIKVGIIGLSNVGKTTLSEAFLQKEREDRRTQEMHVYITSNKSIPLIYFGFIDGSGNSFSDQFKVVNNSNNLIIMLDHSGIDNSNKLDKNRLLKAENFLDQMRINLQREKINLNSIFILLNKQDLWKNLVKNDLDFLIQWFDNESEKWSNSGYAEKTYKFHHSNNSTNDCIVLLNRLK